MAGVRDRLRAFWEVLNSPPGGPTPAGSAPVGRSGGPGPGRGPRVAGPPRSSNGASSFHLFWDLPRTPEAGRLVEVSATLEIVEPPRVESLYFWALQVDFTDEDGRSWGGGHTGLQWNRRFSQGTAANWGGYASQALGGAVLPGTMPSLYVFPGDPNTMSYPWQPGRPYRLRVFRSPDMPGAWRAEATDLTTGEATILRDLVHPDTAARRPGRGPAPGFLARPMVWSEVFADCDAPSVTALWTDLSARSEGGALVVPEAVRVNYQSHEAGGCANTTVRLDEKTLSQVTNAARDLEQGSRLELPLG